MWYLPFKCISLYHFIEGNYFQLLEKLRNVRLPASRQGMESLSSILFTYQLKEKKSAVFTDGRVAKSEIHFQNACAHGSWEEEGLAPWGKHVKELLRTLKGHLVQPPYNEQNTQQDRGAQSPAQPDLICLQGQGIHHLSGQTVPVPQHSHYKKHFPYIQFMSPLFKFETFSPCPITADYV